MRFSDFFKENKFVLLFTFILAFTFPIIILYPADSGFIPHDVGLQIVGYGGSILGGFLTLYGVWWTIRKQDEINRDENEKRDKERLNNLSIQYLPILLFESYSQEIISRESITRTFFTSLYSNYRKEESPSKLVEVMVGLNFTNQGRGEARIYNVKTALTEKSTDLIKQDILDTSLSNDSDAIIPVSHVLKGNLILSFDIDKPIPEKLFYSVCIEYNSLFNNGSFIHQSFTTFILNINSEKTKSKNNACIEIVNFDSQFNVKI
ncbi:hypothetical protein HMPREF0863_00302 [Erysipelotrichaceae bacterium 5_2_54FAA]|nr:hypothetical protein HMPREF0863_00302 [Erysipelotrichaceae bacterium 5_2_54FAA]